VAELPAGESAGALASGASSSACRGKHSVVLAGDAGSSTCMGPRPLPAEQAAAAVQDKASKRIGQDEYKAVVFASSKGRCAWQARQLGRDLQRKCF
jgi:hypothetical protein